MDAAQVRLILSTFASLITAGNLNPQSAHGAKERSCASQEASQQGA